ncbi:glycosyltransferase family 2 protein [Geobacter sp. SVR]|uniref:glycosyltransferase family 2 protein n=1 Tax=Geobacter sp. SVR TaxID=2495594 RepID=UPI00143EFC39|nr:glycosyltransferase family 2 protein [Geobacter sp. SVR]BCS51978.1 hemolytic protein HlpA [Geobacter sp. SVR]GCF87207.1 hemolytic protein HlpA [Geobacter sp. SVR]
MSGFKLKTPVAFLIFNRPDVTQKVFEEIRRARPPKLLVVADGPRVNRPGEAEKCQSVRAIIDTVDWPCEVLKNYSDVNLGCKRRVSSGLDWVFEQAEEAIILEDDCLPHPSFFGFCEELLEKYRDDERIGIISGDNFLFGRRRTDNSYYFSRYTHIWGWASWRRTWQTYDVEMKSWPLVKNGMWLTDILHDKKQVKYWSDIFESVFNGQIDTWDYQINFNNFVHSRLNIMPNQNLISNIGFGVEATRTIQKCKCAEMPIFEMKFPLIHPQMIIRDAQADSITEEDQFRSPTVATRIINKIRRIIA